MIKVVCGIIWKGDKVLICRRKPDKSLGGFWEFPGGKLENDESPEQCLERELFEELGMRVNQIEFLGTSHHAYSNFEIELLGFHCNFIDASFELTDHDQIKWSKVNDLTFERLAPADIPLIDLIK